MREMDSEELAWLAAMDRIEGLPNSWLQTGVVAATIANQFRTKGAKAKPADFMPRQKRRLTAEEQINVLRASAAATNRRLSYGNHS